MNVHFLVTVNSIKVDDMNVYINVTIYICNMPGGYPRALNSSDSRDLFDLVSRVQCET